MYYKFYLIFLELKCVNFICRIKEPILLFIIIFISCNSRTFFEKHYYCHLKRANKKNNLVSRLLHGVFAFCALLILIDFLLPSTVVKEDVVEIKQTRQNYFNAARNYHYSYRVITKNHRFSVTQEFANLVKDSNTVVFALSPLFNEVNWSSLPTAKNKSYYSLRIASGLALPLLVLLIFGLKYYANKRFGPIIFILQVLMVVNIVLVLT